MSEHCQATGQKGDKPVREINGCCNTCVERLSSYRGDFL